MLVSQGAIKIKTFEGITKRDIRENVWTFMTEKHIARNPIPIFNKIPNFEGAGQCGNKITTVAPFLAAQVIKVDPDKALEDIRFLALVFRKKLLVPSPRLQNRLFNLLWNDSEDDLPSLRNKAHYEGIKNLSVPLDPNYKSKVDVIVSGAVAVSLTGRRIGKGEGFADLEYGMMKNMNIIDENTVVIAAVHDCQVFDELPPQLFQEYDVPVDFIVTPTQVINTSHSLPKPEGIYWHLLSEEKIKQIPILSSFENSYERSGKENASVNEFSTNFSPNHAMRYEGYDKGRGRSGTSRATRGRNNYDYREQRVTYYNKSRSKDSYNNYSKEKSYSDQSSNPSRMERNENGHIHVTISVNKKNHVISRTVEESRELDRVGDANEVETTETALVQPDRSNKNNFTIYVGGIPKECLFTDLREELKKRNVKPSYISWKGFDYAFLDFKNVALDVGDILEALKDLSVKGKTLKVNHKQYVRGKNNQSEITRKDNNKKYLPKDNNRSTGDSPKNTGQDSNIQNSTEDNNLTVESPKKTAQIAECPEDKTENVNDQMIESSETQIKQCDAPTVDVEETSNNVENLEDG